MQTYGYIKTDHATHAAVMTVVKVSPSVEVCSRNVHTEASSFWPKGVRGRRARAQSFYSIQALGE